MTPESKLGTALVENLDDFGYCGGAQNLNPVPRPRFPKVLKVLQVFLFFLGQAHHFQPPQILFQLVQQKGSVSRSVLHQGPQK